MVSTPIPPNREGNPGRNGYGFGRLESSIVQAVKEMIIRSYPRLSVFIL